MTVKRFRQLVDVFLEEYEACRQSEKESCRWIAYGYAQGIIDAVGSRAEDNFGEIWDNEYRERFGF